MATIQIRDLPDDTYEVIRQRARDAGQSLQAYLREHMIEFAARRSKVEVLAEMERILEADTGSGVTIDGLLRSKDADRR